MPETDTFNFREGTETGSNSLPTFSRSQKVWYWMDQQTLFLAVLFAVFLQVLLVLVSRIFGDNVPWFSFAIADYAKFVVMCALIYSSMLFLISIHRRSQMQLEQKSSTLIQDAHVRIAAIAEQNIRIQKESVEGFAKISEARDFSSGQHIQRMKEYAKAIASALAFNPKYSQIVTPQYILDIHIAAPLHDIGKVGTKDDILKKRGKLSGEEFELMKMHTIIGGDLMAELEDKLPGTSFFVRGREIAYHHHQRWDGTGYPNIMNFGGSVAYFVESGVGRPLRGEEIPLSARIIALADVYDALRSRRVYKEPFSHEMARDMILQERGKHFDPDVLDAFFSIETEILQIASSFKD